MSGYTKKEKEKIMEEIRKLKDEDPFIEKWRIAEKLNIDEFLVEQLYKRT